MKKILLILCLLISFGVDAQKAPADSRVFRPGAVGQILTTLPDGSIGRVYPAVQDFVPSRTEAYQIDDVVLYNGLFYRAILQTTTAPGAAFSTPPGPAWVAFDTDAIALAALTDSVAVERAARAAADNEVLAGANNYASLLAGRDTTQIIKSETVTYQSEGLTIQALIDYDSLRRSAPLLVMMHQFSGNSEDIDPVTVRRFTDLGFFVVRPQMRGRTGSGGAKDAGGNEIKDIAASVAYVRKNYPRLINADQATIYGLSGGGGNVLQAVTKHPYLFAGAVNYFGIGNFGNAEDGTGWYYTNPSRQAQLENLIGGSPEELPGAYAARNSIYGLTNFANPVFAFHDREDAVVSVQQTLQFDSVSIANELNNPVFISEISDQYRFLHQEATLVPGTIESEKWWTDQVKTYTRPIQPAAGLLKILGYVHTPLFNLEIGNGAEASGSVAYDFSQTTPAVYVVVDRSGRDVSIVFNQLKPGNYVNINGCEYLLDMTRKVTAYIESIAPIGRNVIFSGLYGVTADTVGSVITYTGGPDVDFGDIGYGRQKLLVSDTVTAEFRGGFAAILGVNTAPGDPGGPRTSPWYNSLEFGVGGAASGSRINVANNFATVPAAGVVTGTLLRIYRTDTQLFSQYKHPGGSWTASASLAMPDTIDNYIQLNFRQAGSLRNVFHDKVNAEHCVVNPVTSGTVAWGDITGIPDSIVNPTPVPDSTWITNGTSIYTEAQKVSINATTGISALNVKSTAITGREAIAEFTVSDAPNNRLGIANGTTTSGQFLPMIFGYVPTDQTPFVLRSMTNVANATGTNPMFLFQTSTSTSETDPNNGVLGLVDRPIFDVKNLGVQLVRMEADGDITGGHRYDLSQVLGAAQDGYIATYDHSLGLMTAKPALIRTGTGSPEGVVTAPVGTLYTRTDGAAGTTLYVKESGTGNIGWVAK